MPTTFGDQLKLFALSVDVVGDDRFNRVCRLIDDYCRETLDIDFIKLYRAADVDGKPGLKRYELGSRESEKILAIKTLDGKYASQTSLAYDKGKPLWIVSASGKQKLKNCGEGGYSDYWSRLKTIPPYRATGIVAEDEIRTSVVVPIPGGNSVTGALGFGTSEYIEITDAAKDELTKIAETLGIMLRLSRAHDAQKSSTETALDNLQQFLARPLPKLTKPKIFLASSDRAEADVINVICSVLKERAFGERLDLVYWKDMDQPGNINHQLLKAIAECRYGICYLSQKDSSGEYSDNVNVIFEAGMFHGRVDAFTPEPASWIPIRERRSPEPPFDFAQERILWAERTVGGVLKVAPFAKKLRSRLDALLSSV